MGHHHSKETEKITCRILFIEKIITTEFIERRRTLFLLEMKINFLQSAFVKQLEKL
jgi:hypothetical protein